jgi:hypothetical protein
VGWENRPGYVTAPGARRRGGGEGRHRRRRRCGSPRGRAIAARHPRPHPSLEDVLPIGKAAELVAR